MRPMLATKGDVPPAGPAWCHEVKWDGIRVLVAVGEAGDVVRVQTRNGNEVGPSLPELADLSVTTAAGPVPGVLLDAELVVLVDGRPSFSAAASRVKRGRPRPGASTASAAGTAVLMVFDLVVLDGRDLTSEPLRTRRALLESLTFSSPYVQLSPVHADGADLWEATRAQGLEGIVSKRWDSRYEPGVRSRHWLKFPHRERSTWVVGGWRTEEGSASRLGALLVGAPTGDGDGLVYRGRVGTGFSGRLGSELMERLRALAAPGSPFGVLERAEAVRAVFVRPSLVVDVESLGFTSSGRLRQPAFAGVRDDLDVADVTDAFETGAFETGAFESPAADETAGETEGDR